MTSLQSFPLELETIGNDTNCQIHDSNKKKVRVHHSNKTNKRLCHIGYPESHGTMNSINFSPCGNVLITSFTSGIIELRDFPQGHMIRSWQFSHVPSTSVQFHPKVSGLLFSSYADGVIQQFNADSEDDTGEIFVKEKYDVNAMDLSYSGNFLAAGSKSKRVRIYQVETKKLVSVCRASPTADLQRFHASPVVAVRWFPEDNNMLASAGWDKTIRIWDIRDPAGCVMVFNGPNILSSDGIDINGDHLIAGGWEHNDALTLWDLKAGRKIRNVNVVDRKKCGDGDFLYCAKFWKTEGRNAKGEYVIIGGSGIKNVEMVDLKTDKIIRSWPKHGTVITLASKNSSIAWGGSCPVVTLANIISS